MQPTKIPSTGIADGTVGAAQTVTELTQVVEAKQN